MARPRRRRPPAPRPPQEHGPPGVSAHGDQGRPVGQLRGQVPNPAGAAAAAASNPGRLRDPGKEEGGPRGDQQAVGSGQPILPVKGEPAFTGIVNAANASNGVIPIPLDAPEGASRLWRRRPRARNANQPFFQLRLTGVEQPPNDSAYIVWFVLAYRLMLPVSALGVDPRGRSRSLLSGPGESAPGPANRDFGNRRPMPAGSTSSRAPTATSPEAAESTSTSAAGLGAGAPACARMSSTSTSTWTRGYRGTTTRSTRPPWRRSTIAALTRSATSPRAPRSAFAPTTGGMSGSTGAIATA